MFALDFIRINLLEFLHKRNEFPGFIWDQGFFVHTESTLSAADVFGFGLNFHASGKILHAQMLFMKSSFCQLPILSLCLKIWIVLHEGSTALWHLLEG